MGAAINMDTNGGMSMEHKISVLISEEEVDAKIRQLGEQISKEYEGEAVHLVCILKGSVFITCELAKRITVPVTMDFMSISSYGDGTKEYSVGDTVYMKVRFKVTSDKKKTSQVKVVLSIPKIESVDAKYMDGQVITPNYDAANNVTTYEFTANASQTAVEQECVIQFVPNATGSVTMTLVYDDKIDPSYDIQSTLEFVEMDKTED